MWWRVNFKFNKDIISIKTLEQDLKVYIAAHNDC